VTVDGAPAPPDAAAAARLSADASDMLQQLLADADELALAAALKLAPPEPPEGTPDVDAAPELGLNMVGATAAIAETPSPSGSTAAARPDLALSLPGGWQAELVYSRNETAFGVARCVRASRACGWRKDDSLQRRPGPALGLSFCGVA
jgi:hypothetical protein